jgi:hypothetical protein
MAIGANSFIPASSCRSHPTPSNTPAARNMSTSQAVCSGDTCVALEASSASGSDTPVGLEQPTDEAGTAQKTESQTVEAPNTSSSQEKSAALPQALSNKSSSQAKREESGRKAKQGMCP